MWKEYTEWTPITTIQADSYYSSSEEGFSVRMAGDPKDITLKATIRFLLFEKALKDSDFRVGYSRRRRFISGEIAEIIRVTYPNCLSFYEVDSCEEEQIKKEFEEVGFEYLPQVREFFRKAFTCLVFVKRDTKQSFVITEKLSVSKYHFLQVGIPAFLPWYFECGPTPEELAFLKTLQETTPDSYITKLHAFVEGINFNEAYIKRSLADYERILLKSQIEKEQESIRAIEQEIISLQNRVLDNMRAKKEKEIRVRGLMFTAGDEETRELMNYFLRSKIVTLDHVDGSWVCFVVNDYLSFYDEDNVEIYINEPRSFFYRTNEGDYPVPKEKLKEFWTRVFINKEVKIRIAAAYRISPEIRDITSVAWGNFPRFDDTHIRNYHIDEYRCLGDYKRPLIDFFERGDYVGMVEQCVSSCRSINFDESATNGNFIRELFNSNKKCFEFPDGRLMTCKEAIVALVGTEEENNE